MRPGAGGSAGAPRSPGIAPRLREHSASPQHATPGAPSLGRALELDDEYPVAQLREHRGGGSELGGKGKRQLERVAHRAVGPEEVQWTRRAQRPSGQQR